MPKKQSGKKPSVKVNDLRAKKNPKGGALNAYLKYDSLSTDVSTSGLKGEMSGLKTGLKFNKADLVKVKL